MIGAALKKMVPSIDMSKTDFQIEPILRGCRQGNRGSQKKMYEHFYSYSLSVCLRYSQSVEEAKEVMNDAWLKVFTKIDQYDESQPFKGWLRRICINSAIDHFRKYNKVRMNGMPDESGLTVAPEALDLLVYEDVISAVQLLPPAYRMVFSLYAIDGYKHHEIAEKLGIEVGTSKSNLAKARKKLAYFLSHIH